MSLPGTWLRSNLPKVSQDFHTSTKCRISLRLLFLQERLNSIYLNITNSTRSSLWIYLRILRLLKWISFTMLGANSFRQFQNCILVLWLYYNISPRKGKHFYDKTTKPNITLFVSSSSLPSWLFHLLCSWCSGEKKVKYNSTFLSVSSNFIYYIHLNY